MCREAGLALSRSSFMTTSVPLHVAIVQIVQFVGARGKRLVVPIGKSELPIMVLSESLAA